MAVKLEVPGEKFSCEVQFYTPSIVRVVKYPQATMPEEKSLAVVLSPTEDIKFKVNETDDAVILKSAAVTVTLDKQEGSLSFADLQGNCLIDRAGRSFFQTLSGGSRIRDTTVSVRHSAG